MLLIPKPAGVLANNKYGRTRRGIRAGLHEGTTNKSPLGEFVTHNCTEMS